MIRLSMLASPPPLVAAPAAAQPPPRARLFEAANWLCLPGRSRHLLDAAADDRAQPQRLWLERPQPGRQGSAGRLLLRLSDGLPRPGHEQRPRARQRRERARSQSQFARFAGVCRTFAPIYRQMTVAAVAAVAAGADYQARRRRSPIGDVARRVAGISRQAQQGPAVRPDRPQPGRVMLQQLIANEIEGKPRRPADEAGDHPRLQCAGAAGQAGRRHVQVDAALLAAGPDRLRHDLGQLPREERRRRTARCSAWPTQPGMTVACTNPARPGSAALGTARQLLGRAVRAGRSPAGRSAGRREGAPPTPFLRTEGLVSARCVNDGPRGYLSIRTNADPKDKRTDRIGGEVGMLGLFLPGWGMHLADMQRRWAISSGRSNRSAHRSGDGQGLPARIRAG